MKIWKASEYVQRDFPEPPWLVPGLVPGYGILMIYAHPKTGKSILSQQLAHALGSNGSFLGQEIDKPLKVLYVQSDLPEIEWAQQMKDLGIDSSTGSPFATGWYTLWLEPGWLAKPKQMMELTHIIKEGEFDVVMYDSLLTISGYQNLDDLTTVGGLITRLRSITKKASWLIHHKRKGSPGVPDRSNVSAAGSFAIGAGVSALFDLSSSGTHGGHITVLGRFVMRDFDLARGAKGIWLPRQKALDD